MLRFCFSAATSSSFPLSLSLTAVYKISLSVCYIYELCTKTFSCVLTKSPYNIAKLSECVFPPPSRIVQHVTWLPIALHKIQATTNRSARIFLVVVVVRECSSAARNMNSEKRNETRWNEMNCMETIWMQSIWRTFPNIFGITPLIKDFLHFFHLVSCPNLY